LCDRVQSAARHAGSRDGEVGGLYKKGSVCEQLLFSALYRSGELVFDFVGKLSRLSALFGR